MFGFKKKIEIKKYCKSQCPKCNGRIVSRIMDSMVNGIRYNEIPTLYYCFSCHSIFESEWINETLGDKS